MLSEQSTPVIRATLPAVGAAIGDIADLFYKRMFDAHPELLRDLFNRGNQANGEQKMALAGSVAAFAAMLVEHPDTRPDTMLSRIANKHVSLGITSDKYTIVHKYLLGAVAEVLGDAVTPEVAAAWDEVYWLMANSLIAIEARLYQQAGVADGDVWQKMEIVERHQETTDVISLVLRSADGSPVKPFRPGQYVSVQVQLPDGAHQIRQYSLSTAPGRPEWRITVKREQRGEVEGEVSNWLHRNAAPGDILSVSLPAGDLVLPEGDHPLLLASAGIGITPMLTMLDHLAVTGSTRQVAVVHADRTPAHHPHRDEQRQLVDALPDAKLHLWYQEPGDQAPDALPGNADVTTLEHPDNVSVYMCGPLPFMRAVRGDLLRSGVPAENIHYEVFGPDLWLGQE
ncbi:MULTISPECIES: globin domain-containing protein [unclassified Streptomyces]|uniref:globin domain-containing protein n=1 Tax=unclassified Streptomyces TaxID=2593676 RepID=UPI003D92B8E9